MSKLIFKYNRSKDDTFVTVDDNFKALPLIHQLDAMRDAIELITGLYNETLLKMRTQWLEEEGFDKSNKKLVSKLFCPPFPNSKL